MPGETFEDLVKQHCPLLEVLGADDEEEFLDKQFRIEDGDVGGSTDHSIGRRWQRVVDVISHQRHVIIVHQWVQDVVDHFVVHGT